MSDTRFYSVQIKRGTKSELDSVPDLTDGELAWITDEKELYIGTLSGNTKVTDHSLLGDLNFSGLNEGKSLTEVLINQDTTMKDLKKLIQEVNQGFSSVSELITDSSSTVTMVPGLIHFDSSKTTKYPEGFVVL